MTVEEKVEEPCAENPPTVESNPQPEVRVVVMDGVWEVQSFDRKKDFYTVKKQGKTYTCDCPKFVEKGKCNHIGEVTVAPRGRMGMGRKWKNPRPDPQEIHRQVAEWMIKNGIELGDAEEMEIFWHEFIIDVIRSFQMAKSKENPADPPSTMGQSALSIQTGTCDSCGQHTDDGQHVFLCPECYAQWEGMPMPNGNPKDKSWLMERRKKFRFPTGADTTHTPAPGSREKFWVKGHQRDGTPVSGHYRKANSTSDLPPPLRNGLEIEVECPECGATFTEDIEPADYNPPVENPPIENPIPNRHYTPEERTRIMKTPEFKFWMKERMKNESEPPAQGYFHAFMTDVGKKAGAVGEKKFPDETWLSDVKKDDVPGMKRTFYAIGRKTKAIRGGLIKKPGDKQMLKDLGEGLKKNPGETETTEAPSNIPEETKTTDAPSNVPEQTQTHQHTLKSLGLCNPKDGTEQKELFECVECRKKFIK